MNDVPRPTAPPATTVAPIASRPDDRLDVRLLRPDLAGVVAVTGTSSNAGKTTLCERLIADARAEGVAVTALKVTRTHIGVCPRGIDACGTCDTLTTSFRIVTTRPELDVPGKDTGRYIAAGAVQVLWLLAHPTAVREGLAAVLELVTPGHLLVAEGNSFRDYASADVALLAVDSRRDIKPSARTILDRIDAWVCPLGDTPRRAGREPVPGLAAPCVAPDAVWAFARARLAAR